MLKDPVTKEERRERFIKGGEECRFSMNHPRFGKKVKIKPPRFVPKWLYPYFHKHIGEEGVVLWVEVGMYSKKVLFTVIFEDLPNSPMGYYFDDQLDFDNVSESGGSENSQLGITA
jgi:hypothetical protein